MAYVANQNCQTGQNLRPTGLAKPDRARLLNIQGFRDWTPCQHAFSIIGGLIGLFRLLGHLPGMHAYNFIAISIFFPTIFMSCLQQFWIPCKISVQKHLWIVKNNQNGKSFRNYFSI